MRRSALLAIVLTALFAGGCGGHNLTVTTATSAAPPTCNPEPGHGTMGICNEPGPVKPTIPRLPRGAQLLPDVSEYQSCRLYSPAIFRIYEAGTDREDRTARCHAAELRRLGVWAGAYFFARNKSCSYQVARATAIARQYPVIRVMVVDAETYLAPGLVSCMVRELRHAGFTVVTYTASGTWPGGAIITPWWAASYGARPKCTGGVCRYVAWQFSESVNCRGVFGDCSIDYGITSLNRPVPPNPLRKVSTVGLLRHRASLRVYLLGHGCRHRVKHQERLGPKCRKAFGAGRNINRELRRRGVT